MKIIGLTGGIGSGKTTVAKMFKNLGVPVYNSDEEAKELMNVSETIKKAIINLLGDQSYDQKGLNRSYVASKVFDDKNLLKKLNNIVHPAVRNHFIDWAKKQNHSYVIQETALLFENNAQKKYDAVIMVTAPEEVRIHRVLKRGGLNKEQIKSRMANQLSDEEKKPSATYIILNNNIEKTQEVVVKVNNALLEYI